MDIIGFVNTRKITQLVKGSAEGKSFLLKFLILLNIPPQLIRYDFPSILLHPTDQIQYEYDSA